MSEFSIIKWFLIAIVVMIIIVCLFNASPVSNSDMVSQCLSHLCYGWWFYLSDTFPKIQIVWQEILLFIATLVLLALFVHFFLVWITKQLGAKWRVAGSIRLLLFVIIAFLSGLCATGVVKHITELRTLPMTQMIW